MEVKAKARFIRTSPKKIRLVIDSVRGKDVNTALVRLKFIGKAAGLPVRKLLESAIANATNNFKLEKDNLFIKSITADEGPKLKRWMPRAFGRATVILKRSSHINIVLAEIKPTDDKKVKKEKGSKKEMEVVERKPRESKAEDIDNNDEEEEKEVDGVKSEIFDVREKGKHRDGQQNQDRKQVKKSGKKLINKVFNRKSGM